MLSNVLAESLDERIDITLSSPRGLPGNQRRVEEVVVQSHRLHQTFSVGESATRPFVFMYGTCMKTRRPQEDTKVNLLLTPAQVFVFFLFFF